MGIVFEHVDPHDPLLQRLLEQRVVGDLQFADEVGVSLLQQRGTFEREDGGVEEHDLVDDVGGLRQLQLRDHRRRSQELGQRILRRRRSRLPDGFGQQTQEGADELVGQEGGGAATRHRQGIATRRAESLHAAVVLPVEQRRFPREKRQNRLAHWTPGGVKEKYSVVSGFAMVLFLSRSSDLIVPLFFFLVFVFPSFVTAFLSMLTRNHVLKRINEERKAFISQNEVIFGKHLFARTHDRLHQLLETFHHERNLHPRQFGKIIAETLKGKKEGR